jgi:hypothetical protein
MFSNEDVRELFQAFPPSVIRPPSLILAASGQGFVTREQLQADFERRFNEGRSTHGQS